MTLAQGTRLGPYIIQSPLGAGGMGEVYRARDSRLDRDVAIKVLPQQILWSSQVRQRFEREAKTISSLTHPNICTLYDVGEASIDRSSTSPGSDADNDPRVSYLVMELLDGETLSARIARGALPLDQGLRIGIELADALDRAHRSGVVHRDVKPGNIMITRTGAKLLDFGLAKRAIVLAQSDPDALTASPSRQSDPLTEKGAIVGTLQYMAPEQLNGEDADSRTDIFALGLVLYEMVAGRRAFRGETNMSLTASILGREPEPIRELAPTTPRPLEHLILKCLDKDRETRWQCCHDIAEQLRWISGTVHDREENLPQKKRATAMAGWSVAAILAVLAAAGFYYRSGEPESRPVAPIQFTVTAPEKGAFDFGIALSPDGKNLAFLAAGADGRWRLWVRPLDSVEAKPLIGTENGKFPFWSPEGGRIGFFAGNKLRKIDLSSGEVLTICDAGYGGGGTWNADDVIVFSADWESALFRVSASGGLPTPLTELDTERQDALHAWPHFLPDGRRFLFSIVAPENSGLYAGSLDSADVTKIMPTKLNDTSMTAYADGYLFYVRDLALFGQRLDVESLTLEGDPMRIADAVDVWGPGMTNLSVSSADVLAFREEQTPMPMRLTWVSPEGRVLGTIDATDSYLELDVSPDERRAAVTIQRRGRRPQVEIVDLARGTTTLLTRDDAHHAQPIWTPDGGTLLYSAATDSPPNLFAFDEASGQTRRLHRTQLQTYMSDVSPDGSQLITFLRQRDTGWDIQTMPITGGELTPLIQGPANELMARLSPDGRLIAWQSDESGAEEVYLASYPALTGKLKVSDGGGQLPQWSPDGARLYYRKGPRLMFALIEQGPAITVAPPRELISLPFENYRVTRSGRLLVSRHEEQPEARPIRVIVNWKAALLGTR